MKLFGASSRWRGVVETEHKQFGERKRPRKGIERFLRSFFEGLGGEGVQVEEPGVAEWPASVWRLLTGLTPCGARVRVYLEERPQERNVACVGRVLRLRMRFFSQVWTDWEAHLAPAI